MPAAAQQAVELSIGGMTCASCAARVEKKLNELAGVAATVNFATETARVNLSGAVAPARRGDDGHADLDRGHGRVPVVAVRAVVRRRGTAGPAHELRRAGPRVRRARHLPGGGV